jgi:hypothetical protein
MIRSQIKHTIDTFGYIFIPRHSPHIDTEEIAKTIGTALVPWDDRAVQRLIPSNAAPPNTYSGNFGHDSFPFHTDLAHWRTPPRYLLLRCIKGYFDVQSLIIDGHHLIEAVTPDIMTRAVYMPRRPRSGSFTLLRLRESIDNRHLLRWDQIFIKPASKVGEAADKLVRQWLRMHQPAKVLLAETGDTLIIDNWRMLHARSAVPPECHDRKIERIYLEQLH